MVLSMDAAYSALAQLLEPLVDSTPSVNFGDTAFCRYRLSAWVEPMSSVSPPASELDVKVLVSVTGLRFAYGQIGDRRGH